MRYYNLLLLLALTSIFYSCEEDFTADAEFRERFAINCVLADDTTFQAATILRTYRESNSEDRNISPYIIKGAEVHIWHNDTVYTMRDTVLRMEDGSDRDFYVNYDLALTPGQPLELEALLPNGLLLFSETEVPPVNKMFFSSYHETIPSSRNDEFLYYEWNEPENLIYDPELIVYYYNQGDTTVKTVEIPLLYTDVNGVHTPVYPSPSGINSAKYQMEALIETLQALENGGNEKIEVSISHAVFTLTVYDHPLGTYYSSVAQFSDRFTVNLDEPDFSNIQGGYGIFGTYAHKQIEAHFTVKFLSSIGLFN